METLYIITPILIGLWLAHRHSIAAKRIVCNHDFSFHGWSYVKCKECGLVKEDEAMNAKLQNERWERIRAEAPDHPMFTKEAINNDLMKRGRTSHIVKEPIKWKGLIDLSPTMEQFQNAWEFIFKEKLENCQVEFVSDNLNAGFLVKTPRGLHLNGGFGEHTDSPVNPKIIWYNGGTTWGTDENGVRYYKADEDTLLPMHWDEVQAKEIIRNFLKSNWSDLNTALPNTRIAIGAGAF